MKITCYLVQPRHRVFVRGYGFLSFAKSMDKNIGKNISRNLNSKYSQKRLDHAKQSVADALRTASKKSNSKTSWRNWLKSPKVKKSQKNYYRMIQKYL